MLEAHDLCCVRDDRALFTGLNLCVSPGELLQVEGANGAGKTSLLRILAGLSQPDSGEVCWNKLPIRREPGLYHRDLLYLGHQAGIKMSLTPFEHLAFFQAAAGANRDEQAIWQALERVGLLGYEALPAAGLSAGQQRRVALARLWLSTAVLWILDEPLAAIDHAGINDIMGLISSHCAAGGMVLLTTHQPLPAPPCGIGTIQLTHQAQAPIYDLADHLVHNRVRDDVGKVVASKSLASTGGNLCAATIQDRLCFG